MTTTLLSNYVLTLSLLKNIALHYTDPSGFNKNFEDYVNNIRKREHILYKRSVDGAMTKDNVMVTNDGQIYDFDGTRNGGVAVSFLVT